MQNAIKTLIAKAVTIIMCLSCISYASIITTPDGLVPGDQYRLVFVTYGTMDASSTSIDNYNTFVSNEAALSSELASLNYSWTAIGSTVDIDASTNTSTDTSTQGVPIYALNGSLVAQDNLDLWDGSLANPINIDQNGDTVNGYVFTGTSIYGIGIIGRQLGADGYRTQSGLSNNTDSNWIDFDWAGSTAALHYYAISDIITVPEPGSLTLLTITTLYITRSRKRSH